MRKVLYLGVNPSFFKTEGTLIHYPVIKLVPRSIEGPIRPFTHCLMTSKNSIKFLKGLVDVKTLKCISIGSSTTHSLKEEGVKPFIECSVSTQEGMIEEIKKLSKECSFLYPRSSKARPLLASFLQEREYSHQVIDLYDTISQKPKEKVSLAEIDEIVFTSPSAVRGFLEIFSSIPEGVKVTFQGPITEEAYSELSKII